ncbi:MAG: FtsQ-type POTRA domain-containing protein [Coriobacteriia bacterium]|nr:FtsQ-type POTRA domain-containing protein [Coriobacteriia bacterium]
MRVLQGQRGGRPPGRSKSQRPVVTGRTVREAKSQKMRVERPRSKAAKRALIVVVVVFLIAVALIGVYYSPLFKIQTLQVEGASYLSSEQLTAIAQVPTDSTLLRLDSKDVIGRLEGNPWVASAGLKKVFPATLVIEISERQPLAVVAYGSSQSSNGAGLWLVSGDGNWLDELTAMSAKQRAQLLDALPRITDLPKDATPAPGPFAADSQQAASLENALAILQGLSPDFAAQVTSISAPDTISAELQMSDGLTVSFGQAEDISMKESVVQGLISEKGDSLQSINVRVADKATYRLKDGN